MPSTYGAIHQNYTLQYYEGSNGVPSFSSSHSTSSDFTIISQSTFPPHPPLISSPERLFFLLHLLARWQGSLCCLKLTRSSMSVVIYADASQRQNIAKQIAEAAFPSRLRLSLYVHGTSAQQDCVFKPMRSGLRCVARPFYPINRLRNIAIRGVRTTHFIVFDMDMWPARRNRPHHSCVAHTYRTLMALPSSYLDNPFIVTIIPAFSLSPSLLKHYPCSSFKECVLRFRPSCCVTTRSIPLMPATKQQLIQCVNAHNCSVFRPRSRTHVPTSSLSDPQDYISSSWYKLPPNSNARYMKCFRQRFMEPYVMARNTPDLPLFDERFIDYGFNKVEWIETLRYLGYEFYVLSQAFAVDVPHEP